MVDRLQKKKREIIQQRNLLISSLVDIPNLSFQLIKFLFYRQRLYLFWTISIISFQILEVLLLATQHFVYLPPDGLNILRLISVSSLIAATTALHLRLLRSKAIESRQIVVWFSQAVFSVSLVVAFAASFYLIQFTPLEFSSPPIFRSVLIAGLISLPLDAVLSFLFYSLGVQKRLVYVPFTRSYVFFSLIGALVCLYYNMPILYLVVRFVPKLIILAWVWRKLTDSEFLRLFRLNELWRNFNQTYEGVLRGLGRSYILLAAFEVSLLFSFGVLSHGNQNLAVIIFLIHKSIHIASLMNLKTGFRLIRDERAFSQFRVPKKRYFLDKYISIALLHSLCVVAFFPLLFLKKELVFWISPTGESLNISTIILLAVIFLSFCRSFGLLTMVRPCRLNLIQVAFLGAGLPLAVFLVIDSMGFLFSPIESLMIVLCTDSAIWLFYGLKAGFSKLQQQPLQIPRLVHFLNQVQLLCSAQPSGAQVLFKLELFKDCKNKPEVIELLGQHFEEFVQIGNYQLLGFRGFKSETEQNSFQKQLLAAFGGFIYEVKNVRLGNHDGVKALSTLFGSKAWKEIIFCRESNIQSLPKPEAFSAEALYHVRKKAGAWQVNKEISIDQMKSLEESIEAFRNEGFRAYQWRGSKGFVFIVDESGALVGVDFYLPGHREWISHLRYQQFSKAISFGAQAELTQDSMVQKYEAAYSS